MSILTVPLPRSVEVEQKKYMINTDFKAWITFAQCFSSLKPDYEKIASAMCNIFEELPPNMTSALIAMLDFYTMNRRNNPSGNEKKDVKKAQIFDFDADADLIFAAFFQQYNINLTEKSLHWWVFKALFDSLAETTQFVKVMQYRSADVTKINDKDLKRHYIKMKRQYALPDNRTEEEKERAFASGFDLML